MYVIDASVWVAGGNSQAVHHADSLAFLQALRQQKAKVLCPTLCLIEVAAAVYRPSGNLMLTQHAVKRVRNYPNLRLISLTQTRAKTGSGVATQARLRGADSVYVGLSQELGATLITWDREVISRAGSLISVLTTTDWLAGQSAASTAATP